MKQFLSKYGKWICTNAIMWCLAKQLFLAIKVWGIENTHVERFQFPLGPLFIVIAISGLIDGIAFALYDIGIDALFKSLRFYQRVIIKAMVNMVLGVSISTQLVPIMLHWFIGEDTHLFDQTITMAQIIIMVIYFLANTLIVQFIKLALFWMKTQEVMEMIANPYGIEEERIFLFLDMKSSTTLAERLDTVTYSKMLRECFIDMSDAARATNAEIYQYVGDQAVMTWKESPENFFHSVQFYFRFQQRLVDRAGEYYKQFGAAPEFKAGLHHGHVIKAQVGMMRKEIAFHGDAINTASRIQNKCRELGKHLLVSESFKNHVSHRLDCQYEGNFALRGKRMEMDLYSIDDIADPTGNSTPKIPMLKRSFDLIRINSDRALRLMIRHWMPNMGLK